MDLPTANSGLTIDDLKKAIEQTKEDVEDFPELQVLLEDLPEELQ